MTIKLMTTQWTESNLTGDANLRELFDYLKESDKQLIDKGQGYARIEKLIDMVRMMNINRENKIGKI